MKSVEEIKEAIQNNKKYLEENEDMEIEEYTRFKGIITALEWVLEND